MRLYYEGGDDVNMTEIYEQYFHTVYGYLFMITGGDNNLSEELTQETFYRATQKIKSFRGDCKISTWLCQIAKFSFYQYIDKKNRQSEIPYDENIENVITHHMQAQLEDEEAKLVIYKEIQKLSSPMKDVIMLRLTGDLSFKEIGNIMGQSENWARVTFYRAKQILGKELLKD